jgi:hypothetical protein
VDARDVMLGLVFAGARTALATGRVAVIPVRVAARLPVVGDPLYGTALMLAAEGARARTRIRLLAEAVTEQLLAAPELERAIDRALAGSLTDAVARSISVHHVAERVATQILAELDRDRVVDAVLTSPEFQRVVQHIASSPEVLAAVSHQTQTLADEMAADVRARSRQIDDVAERTVRSWLRKPRPNPA